MESQEKDEDISAELESESEEIVEEKTTTIIVKKS